MRDDFDFIDLSLFQLKKVGGGDDDAFVSQDSISIMVGMSAPLVVRTDIESVRARAPFVASSVLFVLVVLAVNVSSMCVCLIDPVDFGTIDIPRADCSRMHCIRISFIVVRKWF